MLKRFVLLLVFLLILSSVTAQEDSVFTFLGDGETPSIEHVGADRENRDYPFAEQYTDPGATIFYDGQFHMFRNAFRGWPAAVWAHHMVSEDGVEWEQTSEDPVLHTDDVPFAQRAALVSSVIVEDDGTWVLYFYTWNMSSGSFSNGDIGRATADNPQGPWTVDDDPVLTVGEDDEFDERGLAAPQVIRTEDGYLMYYEGFDARLNRHIGLATSEDGINWTKSDANPLISPEQGWEGAAVHQPRVVAVDDGYLMLYRGTTRSQQGMSLGVATSADGITWQRSEDPILTMDMLSDYLSFWFTAVVIADDTAYLFIELSPRSPDVTDIYTMIASLDALLGQ